MRCFFLDLIIMLISLFSTVYCIFPLKPITSGYELIWLHPVVFIIIYLIILSPMIKKARFRITVYSYSFLAFLRMVIIPMLSCISGVFNGVTYINVNNQSIQLAILLVAYELIVTSVFLYIIVNLRSNVMYAALNLDNKLKLKGNIKIYVIFIILSLLLYLIIGRKLNIIQLFIISINSENRYGDITSTYLVLIRQIFKCGMIFFFICFTSHCHKLYSTNKKIKYVYYAIFVAILNVGIIVGERRSEQIYTCLVVIFILIQSFKEHRKKIIIFITSAAGIVLLFMSIYKHFAAFYYGSYTGAIHGSTINIQWLTKTLQSYFFGTQNVATAIQLKDVTNLNITNMLYDFGRSIFGISFLLKDKMIMTTEYFNTFIYGFTKANGHVISGIGYGYIYFGAILSPIIVCLNVFISIKLEKWFNKTNSYELKYIVGYMLTRFITNIFVNTPPLISLGTIMLSTAGLIYLTAKIIRDSSLIKSLKT